MSTGSLRHRPEIVALAAVLDHPRGPLHVVVSCLDWEPEPAAQPTDQTRSLAALATDPARDGPLPVLLTATSTPTTPKIRVLTEVMVDAWVAANGTADPGHTMSTSNPLAPREAGPLIDQRIDYVLARPGTPAPIVVTMAFLAWDPQQGRYPSDHYVVADFRL